jgi:hypothetical protein
LLALTIDDFPHEAQCIGAPPRIYYGNLFENPTFYIRMIILPYNSEIPRYNQIYSIYYSSHPYTFLCIYIYTHDIISVHSQSYIHIYIYMIPYIRPYFPIYIYIYMFIHMFIIFSHHFPSVFVAGFFQATIHVGAR